MSHEDLKDRPSAGNVVVVAPSLRHVKALQVLLGDKIPAGEPISLEQAEPMKGQLIFVPVETPIDYARRNEELPLTHGVKRIHKLHMDHKKVSFGALEPRDSFLANDFFILNDTEALAVRDMTGWKYGSQEDGILSRDVLQRFHVEYEALGEQQ